VRPIFSRASI